MSVKCNLCGKQRTNDVGGCRCAAGYSAYHHIAERLRHHAKDERNTAFARSTMREAEQEIARVTAQRDAILMQARIWSGEAKTQKATVDAVGEILGGVPNWGPIAQGVEQLRANFAALQHAIVGDTGASAILTAERLRAELAASREREARMRAVLETWVKAADGEGNPVTTIIDFNKLVRAALAEGAQG